MLARAKYYVLRAQPNNPPALPVRKKEWIGPHQRDVSPGIPQQGNNHPGDTMIKTVAQIIRALVEIFIFALAAITLIAGAILIR